MGWIVRGVWAMVIMKAFLGWAGYRLSETLTPEVRACFFRLLVAFDALGEIVPALGRVEVFHSHREVLVDDATVDALGDARAHRALGDVVDHARAPVVVLEGHALRHCPSPALGCT